MYLIRQRSESAAGGRELRAYLVAIDEQRQSPTYWIAVNIPSTSSMFYFEDGHLLMRPDSDQACVTTVEAKGTLR